MSGWYVVASNGQQELGPFTGTQLVQLAKSGRINGATMLRHDDVTKGKRLAASTVRQLQEIFAAPKVAEIVEQHPEDAIIEGGKKLISSAMTNVGSTIAGIKSMMPVKPKPSQDPASEPPMVASHASSIADFAGEGQDTSVVAKVLDRVNQLCTRSEKPLYMAVQQKPVANFAPDAVVLTTHRLMVIRQKVLGRMIFSDYHWREVRNVHVDENIMSATLWFEGINGHRHSVDWLPKEQARKVYRIAQEQEEAAFKMRRDMYLEEQRASAAQTVVTTNVQAVTPAASPPSGDPMAKLQQLKQMLEAGLITQAEFDDKKADILSQM